MGKVFPNGYYRREFCAISSGDRSMADNALLRITAVESQSPRGDSVEFIVRFTADRPEPVGSEKRMRRRGSIHLLFSRSLLAQWAVPDSKTELLARRIARNFLSNELVRGLPQESYTLSLTTATAPRDLPVDLEEPFDRSQEPYAVILPDSPEPIRFDSETLGKADRNYKPFPPFDEWKAPLLELGRFERYMAKLATRSSASPELLKRAQEVVKRAAAFDTGAIEGLYDTTRGFTFSVAWQTAAWETALEAKGKGTRALFEAQLGAYDFVLDFVTRKQPIAEAWIRELHAQLCKAQPTYSVMTEIGPQQHSLPLGKYKTLPNHVITSAGALHSYAPADMTPAEMHRFVRELRSPAFESAPAIIQAAYAHYCLVAIHPFPDGNGRVARALASVFTYRAIDAPMLVFADTLDTYYNALAAADAGDHQQFSDFVLERTLDAIQMVDESLATATVPDAAASLQAMSQLYVTRGGYTHADVDNAAYALMEMFIAELRAASTTHGVPNLISWHVEGGPDNNYVATRPGYRVPVTDAGRRVRIICSSAAPAAASISRMFVLEVPQDSERDDDVIIRSEGAGTDVFEARMTALLPHATTALQMRLRMFGERVVALGLRELLEAARVEFKKSGYGDR